MSDFILNQEPAIRLGCVCRSRFRCDRRLLPRPSGDFLRDQVNHLHLDHETNSSFGFNLPVWDRPFGTSRSQPDAGHEGMVIRLDAFRVPASCTKLPGMPLIGARRDCVIDRRRWGGDR